MELIIDGHKVLIDDEDWDLVKGREWTLMRSRGKTYVRARGRPLVLMHRLILDAPNGVDVDHRNANTLDNRRGNLRLATRKQNMANALPYRGGLSKFKGVSKMPAPPYRRKPWTATITPNGQKIALGYFETEEEAARAYDVAALEHFGDFARLNFPTTKAA